LARAGLPEADLLLEAVRRRAASAPPFTREVWRDIALPCCEGLYAYACGDYAEAWRRLASSVPRLAEAGGSHAQRDLFEQFLLDAAIKSGHTATAQHMLERRRLADPDGVPINMSLAAVYAKLGLQELSDQARGRALLTRTRHRAREGTRRPGSFPADA
jgi:hypothetical protein